MTSKILGIAALLVAAGAAQATTTYTAINGGGFSGSFDNNAQSPHNDIAYLLARAYGVVAPLSTTGTRVDTAGNLVDFTGGGLTFTRVADFINGAAGANFNLHSEIFDRDAVTDQAFTDGTHEVTTRVLYSGASQVVGFNNGSETQMFNLGPQTNFNLTTTFTGNFGTSFTFYRDNDTNSGNGRVRSNDANDSFVAYVLTGNGLTPRLVVGIDDNLSGDRDYQDFIFEITIVPNPLAANGALAGLAGMGLLSFRRRRA